MTPKVSLVYAARREGGNVQRTIDSLLATTTAPEWEAIVVDDGHEDNGCEFLLEPPYRDDARFTLLRLRESRGVAGARHTGALVATGDYLVFCDAHLRYTDDWLMGFIAALDRYGPGAIAWPAFHGLNGETWEISTWYEPWVFTMKPTTELRAIAPYEVQVPMASGGCFGLAREWYFVLGGWDIGMRVWGSEDTELSVRNYAFGGTCYFVSAVQVGHLFRKDNPNPVSYADVHYNRLRMAYIHFDPIVFAQVVQANTAEAGFTDGFAQFLANRAEIEARRQWVMSRRLVPVEWYQHRFLDWASGKKQE